MSDLAQNITEATTYALDKVLNEFDFSDKGKQGFKNLFFVEFNKKFDHLTGKHQTIDAGDAEHMDVVCIDCK